MRPSSRSVLLSPLFVTMALMAHAARARATVTQGDTSTLPQPTTLLIGDSMMRVGVAPALIQALQPKAAAKVPEDDVTVLARSATGLARPDVFDWPAAIAGAVKDKHFVRAVVFLGSNDCQTLAGEGGGAAFGTPAWEQGYRGRVQAVLGSLCKATSNVIWLGLPPMRSPKFNAHIASLNHVLESEVAKASCARFVPTTVALAGPKGLFSAYRKVRARRLKVREDDGIHITPSGGELVAETVMAAMGAKR